MGSFGVVLSNIWHDKQDDVAMALAIPTPFMISARTFGVCFCAYDIRFDRWNTNIIVVGILASFILMVGEKCSHGEEVTRKSVGVDPIRESDQIVKVHIKLFVQVL